MYWKMIRQENNTAVFTDGKFRLRLEAFAERVFRVTQTDKDAFLLHGEPMITAAPQICQLQIQENENSVSIQNGDLGCRMNLETGSLCWMANGDVLMREPEENGRELRSIDIIRHRFDPEAPLKEYQSVDGMRVRAEGEPYVDRKGYQTRLQFVFDEDEAIYGLGQHEEGILNYRGKHQFLYQNNLKIVSPVIVSSKGWALLNNCCGAQIFHDDGFGSYISCDSADEMDYFVIYGPEFDDIVGKIRMLTGDAPLLPRWALGYVQSKERYQNARELVDIAAEYRKRGIPMDCVVQDWQTWPEGLWGQKTVDKERYPDLSATTAQLHDMHVKLMWSIWPNMNRDGANRKAFMDAGLMLGNQSTYDAFDSRAREMYWQQCKEELFQGGVDAWWCDCTEPFECDWYGEVKMFLEDRMFSCLREFKQYLDPAQILAYSIYHSQGLYEGQRAETSDKRVVNLTRSGLTGQQRYATICWNGDTSATWEVLQKTIPDGLNLAVTGFPYWTVDAGAFFVKNWPTWFGYGKYEDGCKDENYRELYLRWLQLGTFLPMMRSHGTDTPREIWQFGEKGEKWYDAIAETIALRYRLMPYIYSQMAAVYFDRATMMRMLAFDFRQDKIARNIKDQFMFGRSLMVCPVLQAEKDGGTTRKVYLPEGCSWYDFYTEKRYEGGQWLQITTRIDQTPLFVRAGSILPVGPEIQYADQNYGAGIEMRIYPGADGRFVFYNDAGDGYGYEKGEYLRTTYVWNDAKGELTREVDGDTRFAAEEPAVRIV